VLGKGAQDALWFDHCQADCWQIKTAIVLHQTLQISPLGDQLRRESAKGCRIALLTYPQVADLC
jgi:hypothetical protein